MELEERWSQVEPTSCWAEVELRAPRDEVEPETRHARPDLGTGSPKADQGCIVGLIVEMKGCREPAEAELKNGWLWLSKKEEIGCGDRFGDEQGWWR